MYLNTYIQTSEEHKNELTQNKEFEKKEEKVDAHLTHAKYMSKQVTDKPNLPASNDYDTKHSHSKDTKGKNVLNLCIVKKTKIRIIIVEDYCFAITILFI